MGPILYLPGEGKSLSSVYSFFTLNRDLTDSHTGSAPEARKGIGSPLQYEEQRVLRQQGPWSTFQVSRMPMKRDTGQSNSK